MSILTGQLHKLHKAPEMQPGQNAELLEKPTQSSNEKESTQTNGEKDVHNTVTMPDKQAAGSKASTAQQVGKKHRDSSKFSRSRIFYCNTTTHIGLPHKRTCLLKVIIERFLSNYHIRYSEPGGT